ncbi:energy transducer TonB [Rhabdochromatium marinum]|uniref:energy transducer TonB n=1 Tax=Rhabdochromatium marinum TaxID=48729 RepID=UPI0019038DC1|nr:energy transducer TonB [Rhabdochromatium marinum]MBK1648968.1 hypothetical protein [Rhabdochromatium marinum]
MHQTLRNFAALPLAMAAILALVWLMQTLIDTRAEDTKKQLPIPSVVYLVEAASSETEVPQPIVKPPEQPEPEPQPPEPPEPLDPEPLPETLELPLDPRPLDLPAVEKPPEPKPRPKPKVHKKTVSQPKVARQSTATAKPAAPKPAAAPAKFDRRATFAPRPQYPANAKRRRIEGSVTVKFTVTRQGRVSHPQVIAAHPPGVFEREALSTIRRWRFRPQPADFPGVTQTIRFALRN